MSDQQIKRLREKIDTLDLRLLQLLNERADLAKQIAEIKSTYGNEAHFYRPEREAQVLAKLTSQNPGPLTKEVIGRLFREVMSACLALEQLLRIAYLGPEGTFTHTAVLKHFGHAVKPIALSSIDQVFREVESGNCDYGVVPIENSTEGIVNHTLDMFINSKLLICSEIELRIRHHLLSKEKKISKIVRLYAHQQSLAQCRSWLNTHLAGVERIAVDSNAKAMQLACNEAQTAAIAGEAAATIYALHFLAQNIEDQSDNTTRFLVIGNTLVPNSGDDKTSLLFSAANTPGSLQHMLQCFAKHDISIMHIESRPSRRGIWDYVFFADIEGHIEDDKVKKALAELKKNASLVKLLGSYPRAIL